MAEILLYDVIGEQFGGVSAKQFVQELGSTSGPVTIRINSAGGIVSDGWAIYQAIRTHQQPVTVVVDAVAASIASIIAMAGERLIMADHAFLMIHNPWSMVMGDAKELRRVAATLDTFAEPSVAAYVKKTGESRETIQAWMDEETWFTAAEATEKGFADEVMESMPIAACVPAGLFKHTPTPLIQKDTDIQANAIRRSTTKSRLRAMGFA